MLSGYHLKFLRLLTSHSVRYLVVGAQARRLCGGDPGHDLDLWIEYGPASRDAILWVLLVWIRDHPLHVRRRTAEVLPTELRDHLQMKFPEFEGCGYSDGTETGWVSPETGIDLMIGGPASPTFAECYGRAARIELEPGLVVHCLSKEDDGRFPRLAVETVTFGSA
jgi:hypothetical protein